MTRLKQLLRCFVIVAFASAFSFGAAQALPLMHGSCGDEPGELGTCPPYSESSCQTTCWLLYQSPESECGPSEDGPCCRCQI